MNKATWNINDVILFSYEISSTEVLRKPLATLLRLKQDSVKQHLWWTSYQIHDQRIICLIHYSPTASSSFIAKRAEKIESTDPKFIDLKKWLIDYLLTISAISKQINDKFSRINGIISNSPIRAMTDKSGSSRNQLFTNSAV